MYIWWVKEFKFQKLLKSQYSTTFLFTRTQQLFTSCFFIILTQSQIYYYVRIVTSTFFHCRLGQKYLVCSCYKEHRKGTMHCWYLIVALIYLQTRIQKDIFNKMKIFDNIQIWIRELIFSLRRFPCNFTNFFSGNGNTITYR